VVLWQRRLVEAGKGMAVATTASDDGDSVVGGVVWI